MNLFSFQFYACHLLIYYVYYVSWGTVFQYFPNRSAILAKLHPPRSKSDIFIAIFLHLMSFLNKMEPLWVINIITIVTADDIIALGDDVNIYPAYLSGAIIILSTVLNWSGKCKYFKPKLSSICCQSFWELRQNSVECYLSNNLACSLESSVHAHAHLFFNLHYIGLQTLHAGGTRVHNDGSRVLLALGCSFKFSPKTILFTNQYFFVGFKNLG